ncbi:MAG: glycerol-3-phosphate 1-O-acyltransferase PlsY [Candidatus Omnitrophota bacterium]
MLKVILVVSLSYLAGSIPFGFVIARVVRGIDIRQCGSGNIGATNVFRVIGRPWGIFVFILDFSKAFLPIILASLRAGFSVHQHYVFTVMAIAGVCGHNWTPWLHFKGGKGVATSLGAMIALSCIFPTLGIAVGIALLSWIVLFFVSRYVSLASLVAGLIFFVATVLLVSQIELKILSFLLFVLMLARHKKNITRLCAGTENRF